MEGLLLGCNPLQRFSVDPPPLRIGSVVMFILVMVVMRVKATSYRQYNQNLFSFDRRTASVLKSDLVRLTNAFIALIFVKTQIKEMSVS